MRYIGTVERIEDDNAVILLHEEENEEAKLELALPMPPQEVLNKEFNIKPETEVVFFNGDDAVHDDGSITPVFLLFRRDKALILQTIEDNGEFIVKNARAVDREMVDNV